MNSNVRYKFAFYTDRVELGLTISLPEAELTTSRALARRICLAAPLQD